MPDLSLFARPNEPVYLLAQSADDGVISFYGTDNGPMAFLVRERAEGYAERAPGSQVVSRTFDHMIRYCFRNKCHLTLQLASGWNQLFYITTAAVEGITFEGEQQTGEPMPAGLAVAEIVREAVRNALRNPPVDPWQQKANLN